MFAAFCVLIQAHSTADGVRTLLVEWFALKRYADIALITAWSLFGSSAVDDSPREVYRIDSSQCGKAGAKSCQM